jgi:hypothetical protein
VSQVVSGCARLSQGELGGSFRARRGLSRRARGAVANIALVQKSPF